MVIVIVGAGRIGRNLSKSLSSEDHEVYLVENNPDRIQKYIDKLDVKMIKGSGSDPNTLKKANVSNADLILAVTTSDEVNLIVCSLAEYYGAKRCIARVRETALRDTLVESGFHKFGVDDVINPELVAAETIAKTVQTPGATEVADFADGKVLLRGFDVKKNSPLNGVSVVDFSDEDFPWPFLVVSVVRGDTIIIPRGDTVIEENDHIYVMLPTYSLAEFLTFVDPETKMPRKVIIYGATFTGLHVAKKLSGKIKNLVIIEEDPDIAAQTAEEIDYAVVINGAASDREILTESGIDVADVFIATADNDHDNIISSVLAKNMGAKKTIIMTQEPDYLSIANTLVIDAIINPHYLAAEHILQLVRGKNITSIVKLTESDTEALELVAEEGSYITKDALKNIRFPKTAIVGAVCSTEELHLANGDTHIKPGERVIVFCEAGAQKKVQKLFTK